MTSVVHFKCMAQHAEVTHLGDRGRVVLPAGVRRRAGIRPGDQLLVTVEPDGSVRLVRRTEAIRRGLGLFADVAQERSLVEELIAERRAEADLEEAEASGDQRLIAAARTALAGGPRHKT
jgi:AbrB family looped-hinge helix DNA binding protein